MLLYVDANFASPYALVAFVSLLEKEVAFDVKAVDLAARANEGPDFVKTSITRRVPTLVHDGFALSESSAICEYIDETFFGHSPLPVEASGASESAPSTSLATQRPDGNSR
jgi:glutathione S-transferase